MVLKYQGQLSGSNFILLILLCEGMAHFVYRHTKTHSLHHGTLMLNVNMNALDDYLTPNKLKLASKGVSSVKARVTNLIDLVPTVTHETINSALMTSFSNTYHPDGTQVKLVEVDSDFALSIPSVR